MHTSLARRVLAVVGAALTAVFSLVVAVIPAGAMTVTFVRHGESEGNASGLIDTLVPGPPLTGKQDDPADLEPSTGWSQAKAVVAVLDDTPHDGVYASTMQRTQQTALPYAQFLYNRPNLSGVTVSDDPYNPDYDHDVVVLNGLQEISAGIFEGSPEDSGIGRIGYIAAPLAWTLGLRFVRIPGSEDGNEFDARVDAALAQMEDPDQGGSENPVVFSHGATIMFWTMMNVDNPDLLLILQHPLDNTDVVVVESNDEGGWTLKSWAGEPVAPANLPTQLFVNTRDLIVAPQTAAYNMRQPVLALDGEAIVETGVQGVKDVAKATGTFVTNTVEDIGNAVRGLGSDDETSTLQAQITEKVNGATDLSAGNKVTPGGRINAAISKNNDRVNEALQGVRDEISTSVKKVGETVKKAADAAKGAADSLKNSAKDSAKDAA